MRIPRTTVIIDRLGYAYCVPCADDRGIEADAKYDAWNSAAESVVCDGCGTSGKFYDPSPGGLVDA